MKYRFSVIVTETRHRQVDVVMEVDEDEAHRRSVRAEAEALATEKPTPWGNASQKAVATCWQRVRE